MRTKNVQHDLDLKDLLSVPEQFVRRSEQFVGEGDLLVSSANSWNLVGKACWVPNLDFRTTAGGFISILRADQSVVDQRYFYHWVTSPNTQQDLRNCSNKTTNISNLNLERAGNLQIPLPSGPNSLAEQKRIAAILDKADAIRRKRQQALQLTDDFLRSTFLKMFGDPVTNPMGWDESSLLEDVADIGSGITKGRRIPAEKRRTVPYLAVANVQDKELRLENIKHIEATESEIERYRLQTNDLLLTEGGDPDKLGRGTLWRDELTECIHQNHIFRVRLKKYEYHPIFMNWQIGSSRGKRYFLKSAKQTTGIASINKTQLRAFPLLSPPINLQTHFAEICRSVQTKKNFFEKQLSHSENLFKSLQQRAFSGKL